MPVIVVGADHPLGEAVIERLLGPDREIRAYVSDPAAVDSLKKRGAKVALGDLSDSSHVAGASLHCFSVVLIGPAVGDGRDISFAANTAEVFRGWAQAAEEAGARRIIWVTDDATPPSSRENAQVAVGDRTPGEIAEEVAAKDDAASLSN
ncbi:MAG TPA: NAD(P)H-binding protein [Acidimicrobiia bacterium]|nr:NAD(P)H-binding protein [Acidimicrobiia bacterium]